MPNIATAKILIISHLGFEQSELEVPRDKLREHGATVDVATPDGETIMGWEGTNWCREADADLKIADVDASAYDALVIPGGVINPDQMRVDDAAVAIVKSFHDQGKLIAAVCHAPWMLIEADIVSGREVTGYPSIRTDLANAGGRVMDEPVVVDNRIVTSRNPGDLDAFVAKIVEEIEAGHTERDAA